MFAAFILLVMVIDTVITGYQLSNTKSQQQQINDLQHELATMADVLEDVANDGAGE